MCGTNRTVLAKSGRLTCGILDHRHHIGTFRLGVSDSYRSVVTLCTPITVSLHFMLTVCGVGAGLRHLNSFTRDVTHFSIGLPRKRPVSPRLMGVTHMRRVLRRLLNVVSLTRRTFRGRDSRVTSHVFLGSGVVSRVGRSSAPLVTRCVRTRPNDTLTNLCVTNIVHGVRHFNSRYAGVTRRLVFCLSTGIVGRVNGARRGWCLYDRGRAWSWSAVGQLATF